MLDFAANLILKTTKEIFIIPFCALGFLTLNKRIFASIMLLIAFTMVYNSFLKNIFQIPLTFKEGYAFPSGHMHSCVILWGTIILMYRNKIIRLIATLMMILVAICLIYKGYHNIIDVSGALGFGMLTIFAFAVYNKYLPKPPATILLGLLLTSIAILLTFKMPFMYHFNTAFGGLIGVTLGYFFNINDSLNVKSRLLKLIVCVSGLVAIFAIFFYMQSPVYRGWDIFTTILFISLWVTYLTEKLIKVCFR